MISPDRVYFLSFACFLAGLCAGAAKILNRILTAHQSGAYHTEIAKSSVESHTANADDLVKAMRRSRLLFGISILVFLVIALLIWLDIQIKACLIASAVTLALLVADTVSLIVGIQKQPEIRELIRALKRDYYGLFSRWRRF